MLSAWCRIGYNNQNGTNANQGEVIWAERLERAGAHRAARRGGCGADDEKATDRPGQPRGRGRLLRPETPWEAAGDAGGDAAPRGAASRPSPAAVGFLRRLAACGGVLAARDDAAETAAGQELLRHDLVRRAAGRWTLTAPGLSYLRRIDEGRRLRRMAAALGGDIRDKAEIDADLAAPFRAQHADFALAEMAGSDPDEAGKRLVNRGESTLGWLRRRRDRDGRPLVSERQFVAGERLRADFERAGLMARVTLRWDGAPATGERRPGAAMLDPTEAQVAARQRYERALKTLGPGLAEVAARICCYQEGLEAVERSLSWPQRSAKVVLGLALDRLADHYGIG